ncbi:hypothetical protein [Microvirga lotononidis]|uniref:Uncharacterized protein n=1 Tax=Microvirga lotononidis TaxID=864069 RepID=I4YMW9_9HYPH|nr:hypothetical protein [Microvirga lotononidis]EIM25311.1 hypothetical protein MicloDRAFT_00060360 [Microvirga lotononidis]WQO29213.1 hypothetical protein U0023_09170 [Microvirga lotononidis]
MKRNILGAAIASVAAPYLVTVFSWMVYVLQGDNDILPRLLEFPATLMIATLGVLLFGLPIFLVSLLLTFLLRYARADTWWAAIISGGLMGFCFSLWFNMGSDPAPDALVFFYLPYILAGPISGWICWRIASCERQGTFTE